jgi:hypothetical protein
MGHKEYRVNMARTFGFLKVEIVGSLGFNWHFKKTLIHKVKIKLSVYMPWGKL